MKEKFLDIDLPSSINKDKPDIRDILSPTEYDIFEKLSEGESPKEIAEEFKVVKSTVYYHKDSILRKLNLGKIADLVKLRSKVK
jgi:DNA-binding NarL/FixJ family response regulator